MSYSRNPALYQAGTKRFEFDRTIYGDSEVKQALITAQHGKCCFCERRVGIDGDVEHFRPKQACKQAIGEPLQRPGYYWLAYEWENLYLACPGCNQRHKQNLFPLQNPAERALNHHDKLDKEIPLFINPGKENPEEFIGFRGEIAYAIAGNIKGQTTLEALKLNDNQRSLPEARLEQLQQLKVLHQTVLLAMKQPENTELQALAQAAKEVLAKAIRDEAEFSAAARCALQNSFRFVID